jgi:hypothetical protein
MTNLEAGLFGLSRGCTSFTGLCPLWLGRDFKAFASGRESQPESVLAVFDVGSGERDVSYRAVDSYADPTAAT